MTAAGTADAWEAALERQERRISSALWSHVAPLLPQVRSGKKFIAPEDFSLVPY